MRPALRIALLVIACAAAPALADRETALFSAKRADKALAAKKYDEAESLYRKALEEDATYLPAHYGLAQCLVGSGQSGPAVEELRKFVEEAKKEQALAADWKALVTKAEKQLTDIDASGAALQKILDDYRDSLLALAQRWMTKDPHVAERALRRVLKLSPGNAKATELLEKMGTTANEVVDVFNGKTLDGWEAANAPMWSVIDGEMVGEVRDGTYACRTLRQFEGDFDVRAEIKVLEQYPGDAFFAVRPCMKGNYDTYSMGCINGRFWWYDATGTSKGNERDIVSLMPSEMKKQLKIKEWNTYEMHLRGNEASVWINGDRIGAEPRPAGRKGGFIGLLVQCMKVSFRKLQVELR